MKIKSIFFTALLLLLSGCSGILKASPSPSASSSVTPALTASQTETAVKTVTPVTASQPSPTPTRDPQLGDNLPVSRALAAKMLSLAFFDLNDINNMEREINFADTSPGMWYDKYINAAYVLGIMYGSGNTFMPEDPLSLEHAQALFDKLDPQNTIKMQLTAENRQKAISYALWVELYQILLSNLAGDKSMEASFGINKNSIVVLATPGNNSRLSGFSLVTDKGPFTFSGLVLDMYIDTRILVLQKDNEIIAVLDVEDTQPTIRNCYIVGSNTDSVTIFTGGAERTYRFESGTAAAGFATGAICDIKINGDSALDIAIFNESIKDTIKLASYTKMEFLSKGVIGVGPDLKIYSETGGAVKWRSLSSCLVGTDIARFIIKDGQICAAVIEKTVDLKSIRVCINTTGFTSLYHSSIALTSDTGFTVTANGNERVYKPGEMLNISSAENGSLFGADRIYLTPSGADGLITINSIKRNYDNNKNPSYRGVIEIAKSSNGYTIINELDLEEYLYAVVPSEMPSGYGLEASKVQAVTARSYARNQMYSNSYHSYGAHVDDSVSCQVYNNIPENSVSIQAVNETKGQCLTFNGNVVSANFFSTSAGVTANSGEVWADSSRRFPCATPSYLSSRTQYLDADYGDLKQEKNAAAFFKAADINCYDSGFSWFRWNVEMTAAEISASVNKHLKDRYNANPFLIKTLQPDGTFRSRSVESVGTVLNLEILKRGEGGNILEMKITGTENTIIVSTEYNVRTLIRPYQYVSGGSGIIVNRSDGTTVSNYTIMPSAFYTMDIEYAADGGLAKVFFYGGGNGHGVGMSQNGVKGMIDKGFQFNDILEHYYSGCVIQAF